MSPPLIQLGGLLLQAFEIPALVRFGGRQQLVIHRLIGGGRVVDVLGPDDSAIAWPGIFSGPDASDRARSLDAMRSAGAPLALSWDAFCYQVIIQDVALEFRNPWWIPYHITCAVVSDLAQSAPVSPVSLAAAIGSDLTAAAQFADMSTALSAVAQPGALTQGTPQHVQTARVLNTLSASLQSGMAAGGAGLGSGNLADIVSSAGSLAQNALASLYVGRAVANQENPAS